MSLLEYAEKLTKAPGMIDDGDIDALRAAGWSEDAICEASALISCFTFMDGPRPAFRRTRLPRARPCAKALAASEGPR